MKSTLKMIKRKKKMLFMEKTKGKASTAIPDQRKNMNQTEETTINIRIKRSGIKNQRVGATVEAKVGAEREEMTTLTSIIMKMWKQ